jgi:hypothetical protein
MSNFAVARDQILYRSQSLEESLTPPKTPPPGRQNGLKRMHNWPEPETIPEDELPSKRRKTKTRDHEYVEVAEFNVPHQEVLLLHAPKQKYTHTKQQPIPRLENDREMLVEVEVVGLNPIDWKAPYVHNSMSMDAN